jgi:hypothetical protein
MNKYQRIALLGIGLIIAVVQLFGIADHGLDDNKGWAVSLLISAVLIFIGSGTSFDWLTMLRRPLPKPSEPAPAHKPAPQDAPAAVERKSSSPSTAGKYDFGIHISELDIAIEAHKKYAERCQIDDPLGGNGRSLNWNCCSSIYASMRLAALKGQMRIHASVWNTIVRGMVIRMATQEKEGVGMGDPEFERLESDAYSALNRMNKAVDEALKGNGEFLVQPIALALAQDFGRDVGEPLKALSAIIVINAETAHKKILPELLADLS